MASDQSDPYVNGGEEMDERTMAKLYQELAKGERQATALENQLSVMEAKINDLLAQAEKDQVEAQRAREQRTNGASATATEQDKPEGES